MQQLSSSATELSLSDETSGVISSIGPPCLLVPDAFGFIGLLFNIFSFASLFFSLPLGFVFFRLISCCCAVSFRLAWMVRVSILDFFHQTTCYSIRWNEFFLWSLHNLGDLSVSKKHFDFITIFIFWYWIGNRLVISCLLIIIVWVLSGLFEHSLGVCCVSGLSQGTQEVVLESMSSAFSYIVAGAT